MITIEKKLNIKPEYDLSLLAPPEKLIFFDIETTGLSAGRASLYLIGSIYYEDGEWRFSQLFAESLLDEPLLIEGFFKLIKRKRAIPGNTLLLHYNGDMFDIPFLKKCIAAYRLPYDFSGLISIDLYKKVKPYKKLLGLCDCKLKSVEKFLGKDREDIYNGGELIYVYEEYLRLKNLSSDSCEYNENNILLCDKLLNALLLHNEEDILNMPTVLSVMAYDDVFKLPPEIVSSETVELSALGFNSDGRVLDLNYKLPSVCPKPLDLCLYPFNISISGDRLNITVEIRSCELKYFFADFKEYYYLINEDYAVHKSVGEFVERSARRQATAKTCYQKRSSRFFLQPKEIFSPAFYEEYKGKCLYAEYKEDMFSDKEKASAYAHEVLSFALKSIKKDKN